MLTAEEIETYNDLYDKMLAGEIDTSPHRHDLGDHSKLSTHQSNALRLQVHVHVKNLLALKAIIDKPL